MNIEKLFSYGTLQYEAVQLSNFGRTLKGSSDRLPGFAMSRIKIKDPNVIATSGEEEHPVIVYTGKDKDNIEGVVFDITSEELKKQIPMRYLITNALR